MRIRGIIARLRAAFAALVFGGGERERTIAWLRHEAKSKDETTAGVLIAVAEAIGHGRHDFIKPPRRRRRRRCRSSRPPRGSANCTTIYNSGTAVSPIGLISPDPSYFFPLHTNLEVHGTAAPIYCARQGAGVTMQATAP